jgi:hypothetical protein
VFVVRCPALWMIVALTPDTYAIAWPILTAFMAIPIFRFARRSVPTLDFEATGPEIGILQHLRAACVDCFVKATVASDRGLQIGHVSTDS